jgi:fatty acid desaturase
MSNEGGGSPLDAALRDRRRNAGALAIAAGVLAVAAAVGTRLAYYVAILLVFAVWMLWFVLAAVAWQRHADV